MKKALYICVILLIFFIIYFLQSNICSLISFKNVKPNLFLMYAIFLGISFNKYIGYSLTVVMGLILDLIIGEYLGIYAIGLSVTALVANIMKNKISDINRITTVTLTIILTIVYNLVIYVLSITAMDSNIMVIQFLKVVIIEIIYNSLLTILIYPILKKTTDKIQEIFEFKNILI